MQKEKKKLPLIVINEHGCTLLIIKTQYSNKNTKPMMQFTQEEARPSEMTLYIIRQIAHSYRLINNKGRYEAYCIN